MADLIEKILSIEGGALAMTHDKAVKVVNDLVQDGEVKRDEAQPLIDELVALGEAERDALREDLAAQVAKLKTTTKTIQDILNTNSKEAPEIAVQELVLLKKQITDVQWRLVEREADKQIEENTRRMVAQAQNQLRIAQARLIQASQEIRTGYIDRAQRSVKVLGITLHKASYILLTGGGTLAMTREKATELVNDLVQKGEVQRENAQVMIDELVARGKEASTNLLKTLDAQITALNTLVKAIQSNLSTGTEEALKKTHLELDSLGEQLADVGNRVREAETQVEKSTRRTLEQAREQLFSAQTDLVQAAENIRTGAVEEAQRLVEASRTALDKASHFLRGDM